MRAALAGAAAALALAACAGTPEAEPEGVTQAPAPVVVLAPPAMERRAPVAAPAAPAPKSEGVLPSEAKASEVDALLTEFERLRRLPVTDVAREQEAARLAFNQSRSDASRVRLAMATAVPGGASGEEAKAIDLLEPIIRNPAAPLHGLAFLLNAFIGEQRRLAALAQGLQQNMQGLEKNNQTLQQNVHGLQQKLDALRSLERSLSERGDPAPRRR